MTTRPDWAERGRELGVTLDGWHAIVVTGSDTEAAMDAALAAARVQAQHRRVAVGDLCGDTPALQALVHERDPHGLVDSFLYGVSLNRIAYPVPDAGELFVMPSGTTPIDYEELLVMPRWSRLAAGFGEVGALLLLVVPADAPGLDALVARMDGAIIVGDTVPRDIAVAQTIAWLRPARERGARPSVAVPAGAAAQADAAAPAAAAPAAPAPARDRRRLAAGIGGLLVSAGILAALFWFAYRPWASANGRGATRPPAEGAGAAESASGGALVTDSLARRRADSLRNDSLARALGARPDSFPLLVPVNAGDSLAAAAFGVRLQQTNTRSGAILNLRDQFDAVPAGSYGLDLRTGYFVLVAGAYATRAGAESLLVQLRARKALAPESGSVAVLPFAFLVQTDVPLADVPSRLARFAARGQPVYALRQPNGAAHLYYGAYESPQQAALAVPGVKEAGLTPALVYRIGRVF